MNAILPMNSRAATKLIGNAHEDRFERIMSTASGFPSWYYGVRKATEAEDHHGIDFFAELDIGEVQLQIKSSVAGREKHHLQAHVRSGQARMRTYTIIVPNCFTDHMIKTDTLRVLSLHRERFYNSFERFDREARR